VSLLESSGAITSTKSHCKSTKQGPTNTFTVPAKPEWSRMSPKSGYKSFGGGKKGKQESSFFMGSNSSSGHMSGSMSSKEYKFSPLDPRYNAPQATYVTVLERLENQILKDFDKVAKYVAKSLVDGTRFEPEKPTLTKSKAKDAAKAATENEELAITYKEKVGKYHYNLDDLDDGLTRAYGLIWSDYMSISMQDRTLSSTQSLHPRSKVMLLNC
jgi:hypothetical protein